MVESKEEISILADLFYSDRVRFEWDEEEGEEYFAIIDIIETLTGQTRWNAEDYWKVLKNQMYGEGCEWTKHIPSLPLYDSYRGGECLTEVATKTQIFRIVQSIASPEAEAIKQWMSENAEQRFYEIDRPEKNIGRGFVELVNNLRRNRFPKEYALAPLKELGAALATLEKMPDDEEIYRLLRSLPDIPQPAPFYDLQSEETKPDSEK